MLMLARRSFMAMIGLAPVAMATPEEGLNPVPMLTSHKKEMDELQWAKKRVEAIQWARKNGVPVGEESFIGRPSDVIDNEVNAMRSWSAQYKKRAADKRRAQMFRDNYLKDAMLRMEREVKLSLAPDWVRRFIQ